jgi:hypothetical protein
LSGDDCALCDASATAAGGRAKARTKEAGVVLIVMNISQAYGGERDKETITLSSVRQLRIRAMNRLVWRNGRAPAFDITLI